MTEFEIQKTFHEWCQKQSFVLESWHVPNGFKASPKACVMMKKIGLSKGVCDYWVLLNNGILAAIEFKTDSGLLSKEQQRFIKHLEISNIPVAVCRSAYEATQFIKNLNKTLT